MIGRSLIRLMASTTSRLKSPPIVLTPMMVVGFSGQPDPEENAVFGNSTLVADLSFYRPQIIAIVPEPHPMALAASGLGGLMLWRLLRRRPTTFEGFSGANLSANHGHDE
jgi:hypothetical protein